MPTVQIDTHILNMSLLDLFHLLEESIDSVMTLTMKSRTDGKAISGLVLVRGKEEKEDILRAVKEAVYCWGPADAT